MHTEACGVDKIGLVKESLFNFITSHVPNADLSAIDDIILSYVYSAIEVAPADFFAHVNDFMDMMSAYVADFNKIDADSVCVWMIGLVSSLAEKKAPPVNGDGGESAKAVEDEDHDLKAFVNALPEVPKKPSRSNSSSEEPAQESVSSVVIVENEEDAASLQILQEMFPNSSPLEIRHCMSIGNSDVAAATATLLLRRETGQSLAPASLHPPPPSHRPRCNDTEIKNRIIARYSYVDKDSELKEHKPLAPKNEPKKMVRYRDNKIVSLKGERYTEVPKSDEEHVKKSNKKHHP